MPKRIFAADDSPTMRRILAISFARQAEFELHVAGHAKGLLGLLQKQTPDLLLLDARLPDMDALALLREIREGLALSTLPVLFLVGRKCDPASLPKDPFTFELQKPFQTHEILTKAAELLGVDLPPSLSFADLERMDREKVGSKNSLSSGAVKPPKETSVSSPPPPKRPEGAPADDLLPWPPSPPRSPASLDEDLAGAPFDFAVSVVGSEKSLQGGDFFSTQGGLSPEEAMRPGLGSDLLQTQGEAPPFQTVWQKGDTVLGRFRLQGLLGQGGMGEVWEAADLQASASSEAGAFQGSLQPPVVALKRLRPSLFSDASARKRFVREMDALRRLDHPQIVRIGEVFPDDLCFTMERLEGRTLRAYLAEHKRLPLLATLILMEGLIDVIQSVHAAGIIHRDLKPDNLFLCETTELPEGSLFPWKLKLLDFGIALSDEGTRLTETQAAGIGTAYFMAPEQLEGSRHLTAAVDIYALGILIYNLLTGHIYQAGAPSIRQRYAAAFKKAPPLPSEKPEGVEWDESLESLDRALQKALAYQASERLSLRDLRAVIREEKENLLKKRKESSDRLWKKAHSDLSNRPASEVLAAFRKNVLPAFPERTDFLPWLEKVSLVLEEIEALVTQLQAQPSPPLEKARKLWEDARGRSGYASLYDGHPFAASLRSPGASPARPHLPPASPPLAAPSEDAPLLKEAFEPLESSELSDRRQDFRASGGGLVALLVALAGWGSFFTLLFLPGFEWWIKYIALLLGGGSTFLLYKLYKG